MAKQFKVKLVKSYIGATDSQKETLRCLGLRKTNSEVVVNDNPATRGQIIKMQHLLKVTPISK
jgi:large subunit ribosomal protein L30